ncbi:hypothetical protein [Helicobacter sp. 11S02596-1]|uniref:hypothetical protein n=1 Tax=Helicobacter sp. 11S02596-1 TaxID=1476194 RepID=UPI000BA53848|nr:hypothetical protein [Helicobacter sp. 11S02596-1]
MKNPKKAKNAIEYLIRTVTTYPNKIGFEDANDSLSFKDFYTKSTYLSTHLITSLAKSAPPPPLRF